MPLIADRRLLILNPIFWLIGILAGIAALQLILLSRYCTDGFFTITLLFWGVTGYILWEKIPSLEVQSRPGPTLCGGVILGISVASALAVTHYPSHLIPVQTLAFSGGVSWCLLASGFSGLKQYRQEIGLLFFASFPEVLLRLLPIDIALITAKFTAFGLWYTGSKVSRIGDLIHLPQGSIFVFPDCSGIESMAYLWSLAVLIGTFLKLTLRLKILLSICAISLGFVINSIRVGLMALLVAAHRQQAFEFWHQGTGSLIFSGFGAILLSGISVWFLHLQNHASAQLESEMEPEFASNLASMFKTPFPSQLQPLVLSQFGGERQPDMESGMESGMESDIESDAKFAFESDVITQFEPPFSADLAAGFASETASDMKSETASEIENPWDSEHKPEIHLD